MLFHKKFSRIAFLVGLVTATSFVTSAAPRATSASTLIFGVVSVTPATRVGVRLDGDRCLVASLGPAARVQCGDLQVLHGLSPTVRTFNTARNGALVYNSGLAHPYALVAANVAISGA